MARTLLGMLTPSSNTVLEPVTSDMLRGIPEASAHFGRFAVTRISLSSGALAQFATPGVLAAAELLGHARCHVIGWSGTSASWLGFESDERLCREIRAATGAHACTSVLAINEILRATGARTIGLVAPYTSDVQSAIVDNYRAAGIDVTAERHLEIEDNFAFSEVSAGTLATMVRDVAAARPDAIVVMCTNLRAAPLVPQLEAETGIPIYDSVATVVWKSLRLAGLDTRRITSWGSLFREVQ